MENRLIKYSGQVHVRSEAGKQRDSEKGLASHTRKWDSDQAYRKRMAKYGWVRDKKGIQLVSGWVPRSALDINRPRFLTPEEYEALKGAMERGESTGVQMGGASSSASGSRTATSAPRVSSPFAPTPVATPPKAVLKAGSAGAPGTVAAPAGRF